jgi:hypothetical protein
MLGQMDDHLNDDSADLEDILFLQLSSDDDIEVVFEMIEDTVEVAIIFDDLFDVGYFLYDIVVHE